MNTTANHAAILGEYDFIVAIDTSGSMGSPVKSGSTKSRWESMQESVGAFVRDIEKFDADGIDVVQLGGKNQVWTGVTSSKIQDLFSTVRPMGSTPLAETLNECFKLAGKSNKKDFIIVFTDGEPDDQNAVSRAIVAQSQLQETDDALTILFVQVGDDAAAAKFLSNLDDNLTGAKFDIVDCKSMAEAEAFSSTADMIVAAIND